jgi:hypothetical protein
MLIIFIVLLLICIIIYFGYQISTSETIILTKDEYRELKKLGLLY